ncbi:unnamed protein product [Amoebophrya sp. A25]|nr:unnamed protein product [Amoebophrya sp. A25]|eukprot:GSA25T00001366001.1
MNTSTNSSTHFFCRAGTTASQGSSSGGLQEANPSINKLAAHHGETPREEALKQLTATYEADVQQQENAREEISDIIGGGKSKQKKKPKPTSGSSSTGTPGPGGVPSSLQGVGGSSGSSLPTTSSTGAASQQGIGENSSGGVHGENSNPNPIPSGRSASTTDPSSTTQQNEIGGGQSKPSSGAEGVGRTSATLSPLGQMRGLSPVREDGKQGASTSPIEMLQERSKSFNSTNQNIRSVDINRPSRGSPFLGTPDLSNTSGDVLNDIDASRGTVSTADRRVVEQLLTPDGAGGETGKSIGASSREGAVADRSNMTGGEATTSGLDKASTSSIPGVKDAMDTTKADGASPSSASAEMKTSDKGTSKKEEDSLQEADPRENARLKGLAPVQVEAVPLSKNNSTSTGDSTTPTSGWNVADGEEKSTTTTSSGTDAKISSASTTMDKANTTPNTSDGPAALGGASKSSTGSSKPPLQRAASEKPGSLPDGSSFVSGQPRGGDAKNKRDYRFQGEDWFPNRTDRTKSQVRSRVYVTSASTMHTFLNVLAYFRPESGVGAPTFAADSCTWGEDEIFYDWSVLKDITDLSYMSHLVIRCFEKVSDQGGPASWVPVGEAPDEVSELKRYRVEVLVSFGVSMLSNPVITSEEQMGMENGEQEGANTVLVCSTGKNSTGVGSSDGKQLMETAASATTHTVTDQTSRRIIELCENPDGKLVRKEHQVIAPLKLIMRVPLDYFDALVHEVLKSVQRTR